MSTMAAALRRALLTAVLAAALSALPAPTAAGARVPQGFVGVMADGPIAAPGFDPAGELTTMVASGVESARVVLHWVDAQPYPTMAAVPAAERARFRDVEGIPTAFDRFDPLVANAALRGIHLLGVITTAPRWAAKHPGQFSSPPAGTAAYARYARTLVGRYGPGGDFWEENPALPRRPIRRWQLWNETNLRASWSDKRWPGPYVELLRAGRGAIKRADPGATIVLAGFANRSWSGLAAVYRVRGARRLFDQVAIHPYTSEVAGLVTILERARYVMRRNGDRRKPILVTEFSWPSAKGKLKGFGIETTERGQARRVSASLRLLARERHRLRLAGIYYYNWLSGRESAAESVFGYAGLRRIGADGEPEPKPALGAFRRTALRLEGCRRKAAVATRCAFR
jgi:hypothetical protein